MIDEHGMKLGIPAAYVWLAMDRFVDHKDGLVRISYSKLSELTGQSERSVIRHVKKLIDSGYATLVSRGNSSKRSNVYQMTIPRVAKLNRSTSDTGDRGTSDTGGINL
ncbi:helix-turn-helix domain-containing protein [Aeoliella mucimassa]|uniref:MarR family protein n=1 Tax=Aeoliella mucimassa TaxID=2527972 RepID=A0A518ALV0_9BACT|nr:helix-turn-helix domain-containing protein [Aeoliella mucimassa]QDU55694.1 hypothetical protein Pan181_18880 [Aeoliella mucimassa]